MGYESIQKLGPELAKDIGIEPPAGFKFTGHSYRKAANTVAYQNGATERQREKRFGYAEGSTAMRRYEMPAPEDMKKENLKNFAIGPGPRPQLALEQAVDPAEAKTRPCSPVTPCDSAAAALVVIPPPLQRDQVARRLPFTFAPASNTTQEAPGMTIDLRNNSGSVTLQLGSQARPHIIQ
jgi:hypothetical protein